MKKNITSVEAVYYTPSIIIEKKSFSPKAKFKEIIDYFNLNIKPNNNNIKLKKKYIYKQAEINESTNIEELIDTKTIKANDIPNIFIELSDSNDTNGNINYILKPKNNPFGIISFSFKTHSITLEDFPNDIIQLNNLERYRLEFSAYCQSYESLFISGGSDINNQPIDDFWEIVHNLNNISDDNKIENKYQVKHIKMPSNKMQHSMLYNKEDNSIIIIGGNDKKCFIYNISTGTFSQMPEMNEIHMSPALLIHNNYLYALGSFDQKINYFEKVDLAKKEKWEKLFPKDYSLYSNKSFGVCQSSQDDKIIILGGERIGYYTILYDIKNNSLLKSKGKDQTSKLNDKTLYKLNNIYCANISDTKENSLILVNASTNDVKIVNFDPSGKTDFSFGNSEESDISVEPMLEDKKVNISINVSNLEKLKNGNGDNIISQSYSNNFNNNIPEKITLRSNNKKRNLKLIEEFSGNGNINANNKNDDNSEIVINNEINIDDGIQNIEIKVEQEVKEDEINKEKNILIKSQKNPRFLISTPSLNDQFTKILVQKEDKNEEEKVQDENKIINRDKDENENKKNENELNYVKNEENKENILLKSDDKFKSPVKFKLNQSFGTDNIRQNSNNRSTSSKNKLTKSMYLNFDDDVKYYSNYDFDNHLFRRMTPHYKKENRLNSSLNFDRRIKNPIVKSKKIKRRKINGYNYSVLLEKIIDKDKLALYENLNMNDSYTYKNEYDNHKLYISQYLKNEDDEEDLLDQRNLTQQPGHKYKTLYGAQKFNKVDTRKKPNNIVITNSKNNRKYNIKKILNRNNFENAKTNDNDSEHKIKYFNNNNYYQKKEPNYSEERNILKRRNKNNIITSPFDDNVQIINNSKNVFEPMKSTTSERKKEVTNEMNNENKNSNNNNEFYTNKDEDQFFDIGNKYIENESVNTNNFEDNYNDEKAEPIFKKVDYNNNKNKLPLLINNNYKKSKNNNNIIINTYENKPKEHNMQDNSYKLKSNNIGLEKMESEKNRIYILKTSQNDNENEIENQPYNNFVIHESPNKKQKKIENEKQYNNEIQNYSNNDFKYKDNDDDNEKDIDTYKDNDEENNNHEYYKEETNEIENKKNEIEDEVNQNNFNQSENNNANVNDFNERNSGFNFINKSIDMNKFQAEKEKEKENENQINNHSSNKSIDLNNYQEQEPKTENLKIITNIDNNLKPEVKSEDYINNNRSDINRYRPEKKEIKIDLDEIKLAASKEVIDDEYPNEKNKISENKIEIEHNDGNIYMSNKDNIIPNSNKNLEEKENNNNSGAILDNSPGAINTKLIHNNTKEQINQDNEPNEFSALNNITKTEIYTKENEDYNMINENNEPLGINNEDLINAIKKKITKLINVKNGEYSRDDYDGDNNENKSINDNPIIELESSFKAREESPSYKVRNKKISEVQLYLPKYSLEEQIFRREVVLNEKENENENKVIINSTSENKDEFNNEDKHPEENKNIYENEKLDKIVKDTKNINDQNENEENKINNENDHMAINQKENEYIENYDMTNNNKENKYIENNDILNNKQNEYKSYELINNKEEKEHENDYLINNNNENENIENNEVINNKNENSNIENNDIIINKNKQNENIENNEVINNKNENENIENNDIIINKNKQNKNNEQTNNNNENENGNYDNNNMINKNNQNEDIEKIDMINIKQNEYKNDDMINNNKQNESKNVNMINNKENEYIENNEYNNNNKQNESINLKLKNSQNVDKNNINENVNDNKENISISNTNNMVINKNQNGNILREKLFKNNDNQRIEINKKKKKILNKDENEFINNNDIMNRNKKIEIDFDEEQNKNMFFNDKIDNEETHNNNENKEEKSFAENEIMKIESEPIIIIDTKQKIKKPKIHFIVDESNLLNQMTSTVFIKGDDNKNKNEKENENEMENNDDKNEFIHNKENINNIKNGLNDNDKDDDINENKKFVFKENDINDYLEQSNNSFEEIDLIANHPRKINVNESDNSCVEIDIIGNNKIDKNEIKNSDLNDPSLLRRKNQINEKDLNDDNDNEKQLLKRKNQIDDNNMEIYGSEIFNENIPNRINISKATKLHNQPYLTLFEIMDEPSYKKIDLNFPEIKDIIFKKGDLNNQKCDNIKKLIRSGIPKTFIAAEKPKLKSIYTPQKIKMGQKTFMIKKLNMNNNNINRDDNEKDDFEFNNYNTENIDLKKNINKLEEKNKRNITSLKYTNLSNKLNKAIIYDQNNDNLLYKNITDINIKNIVKNRYDENDMNDNDQNEISETKKTNLKSNYYLNLKSVPNLNSTTDKRAISPLFKKKINISKGKKLNNLGGNKIKKDN